MARVGPQFATILFCLILLAGSLPLTGPFGAVAVLPECATESIPCQATPGEHYGALTATNREHHWVFTPPESPAVIRIHIDSPSNLEAYLYDASGRQRDSYPLPWWGPTSVDFVAVARPIGEWRLQLVIPLDGIERSYRFTLDYTTHDHVRTFEVEDADARALTGTLPGGGYSRVEMVHGTKGARLDGSKVEFHYLRVAGPHSTYVSTYTITHLDLAGGDDAKVWGVVPGGVQVNPLGPFDPDAEGRMFGIESHGVTVQFESGVAHSHGLQRMQGWVVWDGDAEPEVTGPPGSSAAFHRLLDFDSDEPGIQAGPLIASGELHQAIQVPGPLVFVMVDAYASWLMQPPVFSIEHPDGTVETVSGTTRTYAHASPGEWVARVDPLVGTEDSIHRFWAASFPFETPW